MKNHSINNSLNFIGGWYIDEVICDNIIKDFENRNKRHLSAHSARGYTYLPSTDIIVDVMIAYEHTLAGVLKQYKALYEYCFEGMEAFELSNPWNIQKYRPGNHYSVAHCENNGKVHYRKRHLAFMTYLNTVKNGGETEFLYQNTKIRPEKGLTLIWPAHFTHTHRGIPAPSEVKYITTGWYEFFDTDNFLKNQENVTNDEWFLNLNKIHYGTN